MLDKRGRIRLAFVVFIILFLIIIIIGAQSLTSSKEEINYKQNIKPAKAAIAVGGGGMINLNQINKDEKKSSEDVIPKSESKVDTIKINKTINIQKYDPEILEAFKNQTWVPVLVRLIDNSNITITGTKEERRVLLEQKNEWFKPKVDEVLATLSQDGFNLSSKRSDGFSGWITQEEFKKMINDSKVKSISWITEGARAMQNETISQNQSIIKETEEKKISSFPWIFFSIIIFIFIVILYLTIKKKGKNVQER